MRKTLLALAIWSTATVLWAHPVSYKGATSVMVWNQAYLNDIMMT